MKTPPFLLGATLLFWGWYTGYFAAGLAMGIVLEGSRLVRNKWELSNDDFARVWTFCTLLFLAAIVYAFATNDGPADFRGFFQNPTPSTQRNAGVASARTAASVIKWLPLTFFLFMGAQAFSSREGVPLETISLILRRRWKRALKEGKPLPPTKTLDVAYIYFAMCLFAASIQVTESLWFFWGQAFLLGWALWPLRSRRFALPVWVGTMVAAVVMAYFGQVGLTRLRTYLEGLNPTWFAGLSRRGFDPSRSRTSIGEAGNVSMSGTIVLRVEAKEGPVPGLLREASYRSFQSPVWNAEGNRSNFENVPAETNGTSWILVPGKPTPGAVRIASYLSGGRGLLPLPSGSGRLDELQAFVLQKNDLGAVFAEGPGLVIFDARHGPGATTDQAPGPRSDTQVPPRESNAVATVVSQLGLQGKPRDEVLREITRFFANEFTYSTSFEQKTVTNSKASPISIFLLEDRRGHCEYFATATVLMLRHLKIPARYAVGYAVHEGAGGKYVVRQRDGHAWCLVWNEANGLWEDYDTTPASWQAEEAKTASPLQFLGDAWSRLMFEFAKFRWGQTNWRQYILWGVTPVLVILLVQIVFKRRRRKREVDGDEDLFHWPGLDSEIYALERRLARRGGVARLESEPLGAWLQRAMADPALGNLRQALQELVLLHYRYRFDPDGLVGEEREQLRMRARTCLQALGE